MKQRIAGVSGLGLADEGLSAIEIATLDGGVGLGQKPIDVAAGQWPRRRACR